MQTENTKWCKPVDEQKICIWCEGSCVKNGIAYGKQRYRCNACRKTFVVNYTYQAYKKETNHWIKNLLKENCGIKGISRLLNIAVKTVLNRILKIAAAIKNPVIKMGKEYEVDELCTYVDKKTSLLWIVYALQKDTKEVVSYAVGRRTNKTLRRVTDTLLLSSASRICADKLTNYGWLIPKKIHSTSCHGTNHIERMNLNLRTHLKRLNRRTICYSKSAAMLAACLKIYFWA